MDQRNATAAMTDATPHPFDLPSVRRKKLTADFETIREHLIKIGARVIEHIARIRVQLPTNCPEAAVFRTIALGLLLSGP